MTVRKFSVVEAQSTSSGDEPLLRVALATQDLQSVSSHFGSARKVVVYEVGRRASRFVEVFDFDDSTGESGEHSAASGSSLQTKVAALAGCDLLFCLAIGASAAQKVISARIHPVKLAEAEPIEQVIAKVQALMVGEAPPWLRKVLAAKQKRSMSFLDEED
jgi:nitrogen fixation protein NifX